MNDPTTVLYASSTLAQTCAALAAFVGAVGIFRLQMLREQYAELERDMRGWGEWLTGQECYRTPLSDVLQRTAAAEQRPQRDREQHVQPFRDARARWEGFPSTIERSRTALLIFEAWNLLLIGLSLVGFNYVAPLANCPATFWTIWLVAIGTVAVTAYSVYAWTRG